MLNVETRNDKLFVFTPFNRDFVNDIKKNINGARWNAAEKAWVVPAEAEEVVYMLLEEHYGYRRGASNISVIATAKKDLFGEQDSVRFAGIPVARATGRDSGARVCENVIPISGTFTSGGSVKNWGTCIDEGSKFKLTEIPESALEKVDNDRWAFEVVEEKTSRERLEERKNALLEELASINEQLETM